MESENPAPAKVAGVFGTDRQLVIPDLHSLCDLHLTTLKPLATQTRIRYKVDSAAVASLRPPARPTAARTIRQARFILVICADSTHLLDAGSLRALASSALHSTHCPLSARVASLHSIGSPT